MPLCRPCHQLATHVLLRLALHFSSRKGECAKLSIQGDVVVVTYGFHESLGIASSNVTKLHTHPSSVTSTSEFDHVGRLKIS